MNINNKLSQAILSPATDRKTWERVLEAIKDLFWSSVHTHVKSLFDNQIDPQPLVEWIKNHNGVGCVITDHGVLSAIEDYRPVFKEAGLKLIPGVELYIDGGLLGRMHLIVIAKNDEGYRTVCRLVTESNYTLQKDFPVLAKEKVFELTAGKQENIIVTSACMQGVLCAIFNLNSEIEEKVEVLKKRLIGLVSEDSPEYQEALANKQLADLRYDEAIADRDETKRYADMKFASREKAIAKLEKAGAANVAEEKERLRMDQVRSENAKKVLDAKKTAVNEAKKLQAEAVKALKELMDKKERRKEIEAQIRELESQKRSDKELYNLAKQEAKQYKEHFGENFYIEVQNHGIKEEEERFPLVAKIAHELNIKLVASNDVHLLNNSPEERLKRRILRSMRFKSTEQQLVDETPGDAELYLKTNEELAEWLLRILPAEDVIEAIKNINVITDQCDVKFEYGKHPPKFYVKEDANKLLEEEIRKGIEWRFPNGLDAEHKARLEYELPIIEGMHYADYFLIVKDFLEYARLLSYVPEDDVDEAPLDIDELKTYIEDRDLTVPGYTTGAGRGSGVGSLVCYLLGITHLDPLPLGLLFERFLNPGRKSMPDIDSDLANRVREKTIEYIKAKYGEKAVCGIMTTNALAPKGALDAAARYYGIYKTGSTDTTNAGRQEITNAAKELKKLVPDGPNVFFDTMVNKAGEVTEDANSTTTLYEYMKRQMAGNKDALEVLEWGKILEGTFTAYGAHAAGIGISDNEDISEYIPLRMNTKFGMMTSQCDMVQFEEAGLLKFDLLGLKTLDVITDCIKAIFKNHGVTIDPLKLDLSDEGVYHLLSEGRTKAVFQFESTGMTEMLKAFRPTTIEDLIILLSMFRPGPLQFLPDVIAVKNGKKLMTFLHEALRPILAPTYGAIVYQEQVMMMCQLLAGYSFPDADNVRRFMSKKKVEKLAHEREAFVNGDPERNIKGCVANGIPTEIANTLFDQMMDFAKYAFNKSHAAAYAHTSYTTAWLKLHYPEEFFAAALRWTTPKKLPALVRDAIKSGVKILPPDVNMSAKHYTASAEGVRFGLSSVAGVKNNANAIIEEREAHGAYKDIVDFIRRVKINSKALESLIDAGALDTFLDNRAALKVLVKELSPLIENLKAVEEELETMRFVYPSIEKCEDDDEVVALQTDAGYPVVVKSKTTAAKLYTRIQAKEEKIKQIKQDIQFTRPHAIQENRTQRAQKEKEILGSYVTANPMDYFPSNEEIDAPQISDITADSQRCYGIITGINIKKRKKDGREMAFVTLEDGTGEIEVCVFTNAYAKFGKLLESGKVLLFYGKANEEVIEALNEDEEDQIVYQFIAEDAELVQEKALAVIMEVSSYALFHASVEQDFIAEFGAIKGGRKFLIYDRALGEIRIARYQVKESALKLKTVREVVA